MNPNLVRCGLTAKKAGMSGQTIVLMPVVLLLITVFFCIGFNISWYAKKRIALQETADNAAISASRVQGMMLESIATGNDVIAFAFGRLVTDVGKLAEVWDIIPVIEDIIRQIEVIKQIQGYQDWLTGFSAMTFTEAAALANGAAAPNPAFSLACLPTSGNVYGISVPTFSSNPGTKVERSFWTAYLFLLRASNTPQVFPSGFRIREKPVIIAWSNTDKALGFSVPLSTEAEGSTLFATSAAAPYFIPWGDPMNRNLEEVTGMICLMIPGPFWGARLDEVGWQGWGAFGGGAANWIGKYLVSQYGINALNDVLKDKLLKKVNSRLENEISNASETELDDLADEE